VSNLNHGCFTVDLNGTEYEVRPTLKAMKKVQARFGGLRGAIEAVGQLNLDTLAFIISAGTDAKPNQAQEIEQGVFDQGVADVTEQVMPFLMAMISPRGEAESKSEKK
jgi:hypothetical protein